MRHLTIGFTVVVLVLLVASVAGAAPPKCDIDPNLPGCGGDDSSTTTTTTTTTQPPQLAPCPDEMTITGKATTTFECLWKPVNNGSPTATVTITDITGAIPGPPSVFVGDDAPGDICVLMSGDDWADQTGPDYKAAFDLFYDQVPEGYEAWLGRSYWNFIYDPGDEPGTHWCAPQDTVSGIRGDNNGGALHVQISFNAKKGGSLTFTLEPGNSL